MSVTVLDMLKASDSSLLKKGYLQGLREASPLFDKISFETTNKLNIGVRRWDTLPSPGFRPVNGAFSEATGTTTTLMETVYDLGKYADVDKLLVRDTSQVENPRKTQDQMTAKAMGIYFVDQFLNGDSATNVNGFDGLKVRISSLPSSQSIDAGAIDLSTGANRDTNGQNFLDLVDQLVDQVQDGNPTCLIMSKGLRRAFASIARRKQLWRQDRDALGRLTDYYGDIPLITAGYKLDQTSEVLDDNWDGTTGKTSIVAVRFGDEYVRGLQMYPMDVIDHGLMETKSTYRTEVSWPVGVAIWTKFAAARLYNVKVA